MIELFLSKPIWGDDNKNTELSEQRIVLFDESEKMIWGLITSEGRSEARLWLCEAILSLSSIAPHEQCNLFMNLLRSKPRKWDLAEQVLQLIIVERPHKAGAILTKKSHRGLRSSFKNRHLCRIANIVPKLSEYSSFYHGTLYVTSLSLDRRKKEGLDLPENVIQRCLLIDAGHQRRMMQWFSTFSIGGDSAHGKGAKALSQFAFINRDICWEELEWKGKHGQSPAVVATKPHYFLDLDVQQTVENFVENVPEFWSSKEFSESLKDGGIFSMDKTYFINFFIDLMYEDDLEEVWEVIDQFLVEKSFSYLCHHLLIILPESDLSTLLRKLQHYLSGSKVPVNFEEKSYLLDILIRKCGDRISVDELLLLNALFNNGRQLLRLLVIEEDSTEMLIISDLVSRICTNTCEAKGLTPISKYRLKSRATEMTKWFGLLSWCLFYRLSKECHTSENWKAVFVSNKIGFRNSDVHGLLGYDESSDSDRETSRRKHKRKKKSTKRRKRNLDRGMFHDDKHIFQSNSISWFLSTGGYSSSWSLADLPEHLSKHCSKEWMKQTFNDWINAA